MLKTKPIGVLAALAVVCFVIGNAATSLAQNPSSPPKPKLSYEIQFSLLVASNEATGRGNAPQTLDAVIKQLRASLPYSNYRLAATFLSRVKEGGTVEAKGILPSGSFAADATTGASPVFYEFTLSSVRMEPDGPDQVVQVPRMRFGLQVPITTGMSKSEGSATGFPSINYNPLGITTEMSFREATPTLVGTINANRPDEVLVLVVSARRVL